MHSALDRASDVDRPGRNLYSANVTVDGDCELADDTVHGHRVYLRIVQALAVDEYDTIPHYHTIATICLPIDMDGTIIHGNATHAGSTTTTNAHETIRHYTFAQRTGK